MRPIRFRVVRPLVLSLLILSCTTSELTGPTAPHRLTADVVPADPSSQLMITEVMPDPSKVGDTSGEWFEVYNRGTDSVDLKGVKIVSASGLTNSESHVIATSVLIAPGEYIVIGNNANSSTNGGVAESYSYGSSISLNNGSSTSANEWLALRYVKPVATRLNPADSVVTYDSVAYATRALPAAPGPYTPPSGASRGVIDLNADNTIISGSNWTTSVTPYGLGDKGTPGQPNVGGEAATVTVRVSWVTPGTSFHVTAAAVDKDGKPSATNFTWTSDNAGIATVEPNTGTVTGVSTGIATLTATATNGAHGSAPLFVVNPGDVSSISISINDPAQAPAGFTKPAFPTSKTTTGTTVTPELVWTTSDPDIATVSQLGYVTGVAAGRVTVRATAPDGVYGEFPFSVIPADAPTTAIYRNAVEFGAPSPGSGPNDIILTKKQYTESYNASRGGPNWVSWDINATQFGAAPRCDCFSADQTLPTNVYRVVDFDYRNGGYDRGHMVQSESRTATDQENASTFLLTNILPQGAENNQGPWSKLENYLNDLARGTGADATKHEIYVIAGGLYSSNPGTLKGENKVAIPDYTWKIAVVLPEGEGLADIHSADDVSVIAVKMPNLITPNVPESSVGIRNSPWETFKVTVDEIESRTGYDFLANLPDRIERIVESGDHPPVASFTSPQSGVEGSTIDFDGSASSDPDNDALTYAWDFGDGSNGTDVKPTHTYVDNGDYTVTLTVTDPTGVDDTKTRTVHVSNAAPVVTSLSAMPFVYSGESVFATAEFTDAGTNDSPWKYSFDWGAGSTSDGITSTQGAEVGSSRSFLQAGSYSVSFTATDKDLATSAVRTATFQVRRLPTSLVVNPQRINLQGAGDGQVIVTVLGTQTISAAAIDLQSVRIGNTSIDATGNDGFKSTIQDVDNDGIADLTLHFTRSALVGDGQLNARSTQLTLRANLTDGRQMEARGAVNVGSKD